ncbi:MAG: single-stranded-DNA-specific exonuclease RecJ, partial [Deltaproteobacteria bacterium CG_4_10_14_0_2_um_filter_43_8]
EKNICGCGVAFFFAMALRKRLREENFFTDHNEPHLAQYLDFVALGTVADVMPLTGANRIFVHFGLKQLNQSSHLGLRALISTSDCKGKITPTHVGFRLGPRINAAGRMESAQTALELFLSSQKENAYYLSGELERLNSLRQKTEEKILRGALHQLEDGSAEELAGITVFDASWHIGIAGIVASRLVDRFQVPSVVLAQEKETIRGSVRSPQGTNVLECLQACEHLLVQYGGHAQAAGVVIKEENIPAFKKLFEEVCAQKTKNTSLPKRNVDALVSPGILTENIIQELELLAPFGLGNPEPCFAVENIKLLRQSIVGKHHLKFQVKDEHTVTDAIAFGKADHEENIHLPHHITYRPEINHFRGKSTIQLKIKELIALDIPAENLE